MSAAPAHPVDIAHLSRYTGGDAALNAEVLQLFVDQSAMLLRELQGIVEAQDAKGWKHVTHSLKGAARGIGAFGLADIAAEAEPLDPTVQTAETLTAVAALRAKADTVHLFIKGYLGR